MNVPIIFPVAVVQLLSRTFSAKLDISAKLFSIDLKNNMMKNQFSSSFYSLTEVLFHFFFSFYGSSTQQQSFPSAYYRLRSKILHEFQQNSSKECVRQVITNFLLLFYRQSYKLINYLAYDKK